MSILVENPVHTYTVRVLCEPTSVLIQGWVQSSLEHLQGWRSHNLSRHLFQYFTTLKVIFFSLCLIRICHVLGCVCCLSSFNYPSLRRVWLCLPTAKPCGTYNHNCRNNKYCLLKYINVREVYNTN